MTAPVGSVVGLYVDLVAPVAVGDVLETASGRRYGVVDVRVQQRGQHAGRRQHLRCLVFPDDVDVGAATVHQIRWYKRPARRRR